MVKGKSYRIKGTGQYVSPSEVDTETKTELSSGKSVVEDWEKMSKSKYNGVDPSEILQNYGSDVTKLLILSDVAPQSDRKWNPEDSHKRIFNMQLRIWALVHQAINLQKRNDIPDIPKEKYQGFVEKLWDGRNFYVRVSVKLGFVSQAKKSFKLGSASPQKIVFF